MAQVNIEEVVEHLNSDMRRALAEAVRQVIPEAQFNEYNLFRAFKRAVGRKCDSWERVPDQHVRAAWS